MSSELKLINKYFKQMFPFVIEVTEFHINTIRQNISFSGSTCKFELDLELVISINVSHIHFCQIMEDDNVRIQISNIMEKETHSLLKCSLPDWKGKNVKFVFSYEKNNNDINILDTLSHKI